MGRSAPPGLATFDSATGLLGGVAGTLRGEGFPALGQTGLWPAVAPHINLLPEKARDAVFSRGGATEALDPDRVADVDPEKVAQWIVDQYPRRRYPAVMIGSANGALGHACAAMRIPLLPQTFLTLIGHDRHDPDDVDAAFEVGRRPAERLCELNPDIAVHHMHDPNQDRRMTPRVTYLRLKFLKLPRAYENFLRECLEDGGTIYLSECGLSWPVKRIGERHVFQFGAAGGATKKEYLEGGPRVKAHFRSLGIDRERWQPPEPDDEVPEAEWGFEPSLRSSLDAFARSGNHRTVRIKIDDPECASPAVADFYRRVFTEAQIDANRLIVPSFVLQDPYWTLRTGSIPLWMLFNVEKSQQRIRDYVESRGPFREIGLMLFPNAAEAVGQGSIESWRAILELAEGKGYFLGVDEKAYPRDFAAMKRYHTDLKALRPHHPLPDPAPLGWFERAVRESDEIGLDPSAQVTPTYAADSR